MTDFAKARSQMVDTQLRTTDVNDADVLAAFLAIPRELFVPSALKPLAYIDEDLDLGVAAPAGQRRMLMKPAVLGKLVQLAQIGPDDKVLVVAAATGYGAAIAAKLGRSVVALEEDAGLAATATQALAAVGADNVKIVRGPLTAGAAADAPFDVILVLGAAELVPDSLAHQLAEGGRLVIIEGRSLAGAATVRTRVAGEISGRRAFNAAAAVLPGFERPKAFVF